MKILFLLSAFVLNALILLAQNEPSTFPPKRFTRTEILAGPSIIAIRDNPLNQYQRSAPDIGFAVGFGKGYVISKYFQFQGRIFYERKGGKYYSDEQYGGLTYKDGFTTSQIYTCITIPLTISYSIGKRTKYQFETGPYISCALATAVYESSSVSNFKQYTDRSEEAKRVDYGYAFAFGVTTPIKRTNNLSIRLFNIWGIPNVLNSTSDTWRTFSLILMIGYPIPKI